MRKRKLIKHSQHSLQSLLVITNTSGFQKITKQKKHKE